MISFVFWSFVLALVPLAAGLGWRFISVLGNLIEVGQRPLRCRSCATASTPSASSFGHHRTRLSTPTLVNLRHPLQWARGLHAERPSRTF